MRRRHNPSEDQGSPAAIKLAWWAGFLATLVLVFALAQAKGAHAMTPPEPSSVTTNAFDAEEEDEGEEIDFELEAGDDEWEFEEECEVFGDDEEEEEICEEAADEDRGGAPDECLLREATATVTAIPSRDTVRLAIAYAARAPIAAKVEYSLRGGRGALRLGEERGRLGRQGTYRVSQHLTERQMRKALAAHSFTVEIQAVNTPRYCQAFFNQKLTVRRAAAAGFTWSEPAARAAARARR